MLLSFFLTTIIFPIGPNSVYRRAQAPNSNSTTLKSSQHSRISTTAPTHQINKSNANATNGTGTRPTSCDDERRPPKRQRVDKGSKLPPKTPVQAPREPEARQNEEDDDDEDEDDEEEEEVPQSKGTGKCISLVTGALEAIISRGIQKGIEDEELKSLSTGAPGLMRASKYYIQAIDMFMSITYLVSWVMVKSKRFRKHLLDIDSLDIGTTQLHKPEEDRMLANYKSLIVYCPVIDTFFKFAERLRSYHEYDVILREMDSKVSAVHSSNINQLARVYRSEAGLGQAAKTHEDPREESGKESEAATSNDAANNPKKRPRASNGSNVPLRRHATSRLSPSFSDNPNFEGGDDELGGGDSDEGGEDNDKGGEDNDKGGEDNDKGGEDNDKGGEDNDKGGEDNNEGGEDNDEGGYLPMPQWEVYNSPDDEE
uniref:Uncharacterized protein n=1 Tax=Moniliophthora roreri TaxID=221103 RepID=A0A0W0FHY4_MONRR